MCAARVHALVVGDRFIGAELFAGALEAAADQAGVPLTIKQLQIDYPAVDAVPLPTLSPAAPPRPLWEDPQEAVARADADLSADPTIREYTGPVDLLVPHLAGIEALLVHLAPISRNAVDAADRLRAIGCARGGAVNLNQQRINERGIPVFYCPGRNAQAVAEYVMGGVLALSRGIAAGSAGIADGLWRLDLYSYALAGPELYGRTCGIVGFGGVGRAFAPIARGFGLRLLVHDPYVNEDEVRAAGAEPVDLDILLSSSQIVVLAARLSDETRGLIGKAELALLQPNCIFVNPARAELVDTAALADALERRAIAGAVIDVFSPEPPVAHDRLLSLDNVLLTPHIAGASKDAAERGAQVVCRKLVAYLADGSLDGVLNRAAVEQATTAGDAQ
jgi:D-3-phosphoglycerate dehydrogenase